MQPAIYSISIVGPYGLQATGDTPSRRKIFASYPPGVQSDDRAATQILSALITRAYRRPVTESDLRGPLALYKTGRAEGGFDAGIEMALGRPGRKVLSNSTNSSAGIGFEK